MTFEIIDIHPHIISNDTERYPLKPTRGKQSEWSKERPQTFEHLVAQMDEAGVAKAAIVHASTYYGVDNSYLADSIARDPKRFTGVCSINMLADDAASVFDGWLKRGMTGLRIFTGGATNATEADWLDDPRTFPVWELARERSIAVCIQTTHVGLPKVRFLLDKFPSVKVILDHMARPKLDDGPPYNDAKPVTDLSAYPNLYLKITPRTFALSKTGHSTPDAFFPHLASIFGTDRIAFGSNHPADKGTMTEIVAAATACLSALSDADIAMIMGGTAKRLYPVFA